jgi:hypothetical protein
LTAACARAEPRIFRRQQGAAAIEGMSSGGSRQKEPLRFDRVLGETAMAGKRWQEGLMLGDLSIEQIVGLAAFPVAFVIDVLALRNFRPDSVEFYTALLGSTAGALFMQQLASTSIENKLKQTIDSTNPNKDNLIYLGSYEKGIDWFIENRGAIEAVSNIIYRPKDTEAFKYLDEKEKKYFSVVKELLHDGCRWRDIYLDKGDFHHFKYHETTTKIQQSLGSQATVRYSANVVETYLPLFPLMTIHLKNDEHAVLFGWGYQKGDEARIYLSTEKTTVMYFEGYFNAVWDKAKPVMRDGTLVKSHA